MSTTPILGCLRAGPCQCSAGQRKLHWPTGVWSCLEFVLTMTRCSLAFYLALQPRHQQDSRAHNDISGVSSETGVCRELSGLVLSTSAQACLELDSVASETACRPHVLPVASDCRADEQDRWSRGSWRGCCWPSWSSCMEQHLSVRSWAGHTAGPVWDSGPAAPSLSFLSACL